MKAVSSLTSRGMALGVAAASAILFSASALLLPAAFSVLGCLASSFSWAAKNLARIAVMYTRAYSAQLSSAAWHKKEALSRALSPSREVAR